MGCTIKRFHRSKKVAATKKSSTISVPAVLAAEISALVVEYFALKRICPRLNNEASLKGI